MAKKEEQEPEIAEEQQEQNTKEGETYRVGTVATETQNVIIDKDKNQYSVDEVVVLILNKLTKLEKLL